MKTKLLILVLLFSSVKNVMGQITLEHTYPNSGYFLGSYIPPLGVLFGEHTFYLVHLETDSDKYVCVDRTTQTLTFYNLDHSFYKTINYSGVYTGIGPDQNYDLTGCDILYISQNLFNMDNKIEFLYTYLFYYSSCTCFRAITQIVNEDGVVLFSDSAAPIVKLNVHEQFYPIYNTKDGTKMILSNVDGSAEVFSLAGTFTNGIIKNNIISSSSDMSLFPNPAVNSSTITISYELPLGIKTALLIVTDGQGKEIRTYKIGTEMDRLIINSSEFPTGNYFYSIFSHDGTVLGTRKSIVVK